jgi:hypothetical protein
VACVRREHDIVGRAVGLALEAPGGVRGAGHDEPASGVHAGHVSSAGVQGGDPVRRRVRDQGALLARAQIRGRQTRALAGAEQHTGSGRVEASRARPAAGHGVGQPVGQRIHQRVARVGQAGEITPVHGQVDADDRRIPGRVATEEQRNGLGVGRGGRGIPGHVDRLSGCPAHARPEVAGVTGRLGRGRRSHQHKEHDRERPSRHSATPLTRSSRATARDTAAPRNTLRPSGPARNRPS